MMSYKYYCLLLVLHFQTAISIGGVIHKHTYVNPTRPNVHFKDNGKFRIATFTDL